jgi:ribosomal protein S20
MTLKDDELVRARRAAIAETTNAILRDRAAEAMGALPPVEDPLREYQREAAEQEARFARETAADERKWQRERRERAESITISELRAEVEAMRSAISAGDAEVINTVTEAFGPVLEKIASKVDELERLLNGLRSLSTAERDAPVDLPRIPMLHRSRRDAN